jgi:hypothetical protein
MACTDSPGPTMNGSTDRAGSAGASAGSVSGGAGASSAGASGAGGIVGILGGANGVSSSGAGNGGTPASAGLAGMSGSPSSGQAGQSPTGGDGGAAGAAVQDPPKIVLFEGADLSAWQSRDGGGAAPWTISDGAFVVAPGSGDIQTRQAFGDIQLHVEFWVPQTPTSNAEQDRGNSGIYLQGRYEVQVLDSYMHPLDGANDCGAIYELKNADVNAALPPENWQTYEITFHAPRWSGQTKTENARISVVWNGKQAQSNVEVPAPTRLGDAEAPGSAPLRLQDHAHSVRYRNVWLREL